MSRLEVKKLFEIRKGRYLPCGLNIIEKLWWNFIPGVTINVKWPTGKVTAGPGPDDPRWFDCGGASYVEFESADPNDHYRPWLEANVGKQGRDWNWGMADRDATDNRLTIKIRRKYQDCAIIASLMWA